MYVFGFGTVLDTWVAAVDGNPWPAHAGSSACATDVKAKCLREALYTPEQRHRRDSTIWTLVQAILAPVQFLVFLVSLALVILYLTTGAAESAAIVSVVVKTLVLYAIMVTGAIWERVVFGRFLFAPAFFWEDVVSILVLGLHSLYLVALASGAASVETLMAIALAAYASYVVNAAQFIVKFSKGRADRPLNSGTRHSFARAAE